MRLTVVLNLTILHGMPRTSLKRLAWVGNRTGTAWMARRERLNGSHGIGIARVAERLAGIWVEAVHAYWQVSGMKDETKIVSIYQQLTTKNWKKKLKNVVNKDFNLC